MEPRESIALGRFDDAQRTVAQRLAQKCGLAADDLLQLGKGLCADLLVLDEDCKVFLIVIHLVRLVRGFLYFGAIVDNLRLEAALIQKRHGAHGGLSDDGGRQMNHSVAVYPAEAEFVSERRRTAVAGLFMENFGKGSDQFLSVLFCVGANDHDDTSNLDSGAWLPRRAGNLGTFRLLPRSHRQAGQSLMRSTPVMATYIFRV